MEIGTTYAPMLYPNGDGKNLLLPGWEKGHAVGPKEYEVDVQAHCTNPFDSPLFFILNLKSAQWVLREA